MTDVVWKYDVPSKNEFTLDLPAGYEVLSVQSQRGKLQMWVRHDTDRTKEPVKFCLVGTGMQLPSVGDDRRLHHVATIQSVEGHIVLHLFEARTAYNFPLYAEAFVDAE